MSALELVSFGRLLHKGGEACIYEVQVGSRKCMLKWYNRGCGFEKGVLGALAQKRIPGAYHIVESGVFETHAYLLYECVEGVSTRDLPTMPVLVALKLMRKLAQTLGALREPGISHGDLNPSNVIIAYDANPVLIDFGIVGPGALAYAAPERFQGKPADVKSDLYSLGMLLFSWIAGETLIRAGNYDEFARAAAEIDLISPTEMLYGISGNGTCENLPPEMLKALEPLWNGLLRKEPEERFEDFDELDEQLEIALKEIGAGAVVESLSMDSFASAVREKMAGERASVQNGGGNAEKRELPFRLRGAAGKKCPKWVPIGVVAGIVMLLVCIYLVFLNPVADIDGTGAEIIRKSRNLEKSASTMLTDSLETPHEEDMENVLQGLPLPVGDSSDAVMEP